MSKAVSLSFGALLLLAIACSRTIRVPPSDYDNPGRAHFYRIHTVRGEIFRARSYAIVDSSVVVKELSQASLDGEQGPTVPFEIPLRDVVSIERIALDRGKASVWVFAVGAVILTILFFSGLEIATN